MTKIFERKSPERSGPVRLYQKVARQLQGQIRKGTYKPGDRLPAERELAAIHGVSRPAVREAILALEVMGIVEVRLGSGAYVLDTKSNASEEPGFSISAFELMEARVLFESEAAALAALHITQRELDELEVLVDKIADANAHKGESERHDESFHRLIARASRNSAVELAVGNLWDLRTSSPACALLHEKARTANVQPVVDEHTHILEALRSGDAEAARQAMRAHLSAVIDHLLFAIEEEAVENAKASIEPTRRRYARSKAV